MDILRADARHAFDLPEWRHLASADPAGHVFATPEWARAWWEEFGAAKELVVLTFLDPGPVGLAALVVDRTEQGGRLQFLGGAELTDYVGPLAIDGRRLPAIAEALLAYAVQEIPGWSFFDAPNVPEHVGRALAEAAASQGLVARIEPCDVSVLLPLPRSLDDYLDGLPDKRRHELARKWRRFEREAPGASLEGADAVSLDAALTAFVGLHRSSNGSKGTFMTAPRARFFRRIAHTFQQQGLLRLDALNVKGRRIAWTFGFAYRGSFYLYNSAYDRGFETLAPGLVLLLRLIERSIGEGHSYFDFLRGDERYKFDLGGVAVPLTRLHVLAPGRARSSLPGREG
jgi:CelD/BcsL family acetyltransferase involved in cellulose biosynthesis